ncbi:ATP-binding protein [Rhodocyclus tenuis]|uniref:ATP-binding protein n=1 Tax=Rhodocyclus tenuis TaxID=1066 RepID=UPI0019052E0E|nr:ATP-binding protein [Rhodocyclus tenuis]MBK1680843.1 hypothetical protein [Rhodocyclus tenuis]
MPNELNARAANGLRLIWLLWAAIALIVAYFCFDLWRLHTALDVAARSQALSFVRLVQQHVSSTIERANMTLLEVSERVDERDFFAAQTLSAERRQALEDILRRHQQRTAGVIAIAIADADGYVFANSLGRPPGRNLGDRRYFLELKSAPRARPIVSEAIYGRISGKWGIQIARRVDNANGEFAGMLVVSMGLVENFESFYQTIDLGRDSFITLRDADNRMMVRYPVVPEILGKTLTGNPSSDAVAEGAFEDVVYSRSPIDQVDRIVALRKVPDYPVYAIVGLSREALFASWNEQVRLALFMALAIVVAGGLVTQAIIRRQRAEEAMAAARQAAEEANVAKSTFLAAASHDLRQPLQAIGLFRSALVATPLSDEQRRLSEGISLATQSLTATLNALLDISQLDAGAVAARMRPFAVDEMFRRIDAEFSPAFLERQLRFKLYLPLQPLAVYTDPELLLSLLRNIIGNALKYTAQGGVLVGVRQRGEQLLLQVWDTGIGIAPEHLPQLFDEYYQVGNPARDRSRGLGLGLSIVRRLARLISAEVGCRSRPGRGSLFEVRLPLAKLPAAVDSDDGVATVPLASGELARPALQGLSGRTIAIVEDDQLVAQAMASSFAALGMRVSVYASAEEALAAPDINEADFHIADCRLPGRLDGSAYLGTLQALSTLPLKAVLLSGDAKTGLLAHKGDGRWPVLEKPVELQALLAALTASEPPLS